MSHRDRTLNAQAEVVLLRRATHENRLYNRIGLVGLTLLLIGCSLLVDPDVPARHADSGAGASQSVPTAGAAMTTRGSTNLPGGGDSNRASPTTTSPGAAHSGGVNSGAAAGVGGNASAANSAYTTISQPSGGSGSGQQGSGGNTLAPTSTLPRGGASGSGSNPSGGMGVIGSGGAPITGGSPNLGGARSTGMTETSPTALGCGLGNVFCDSFEQNNLGNADLAEQWSENDLINISNRSLGSASWEEAGGVNGTGALRIHLVGTPGNDGVVGMLRKDLVKDLKLTTSGVVQVDFDFRYSGADFYPFGLFCGDNNYKITFNLGTNGVDEQDGFVSPGDNPLPLTPLNKDWHTTNTHFRGWTHIRLELNRGKASFSMAVDGQPILDLTELRGNVSTSGCEVGIGVYYAASSGPMEFDAYFDNVRIRVD